LNLLTPEPGRGAPLEKIGVENFVMPFGNPAASMKLGSASVKGHADVSKQAFEVFHRHVSTSATSSINHRLTFPNNPRGVSSTGSWQASRLGQRRES
jgi:hypothetical protein